MSIFYLHMHYQIFIPIYKIILGVQTFLRGETSHISQIINRKVKLVVCKSSSNEKEEYKFKEK